MMGYRQVRSEKESQSASKPSSEKVLTDEVEDKLSENGTAVKDAKAVGFAEKPVEIPREDSSSSDDDDEASKEDKDDAGSDGDKMMKKDNESDNEIEGKDRDVSKHDGEIKEELGEDKPDMKHQEESDDDSDKEDMQKRSEGGEDSDQEDMPDSNNTENTALNNTAESPSSDIHPASPPRSERRESDSSSSSGSSNSPTKVPPPTAPKGTRSPPNQGLKMPASRTDNMSYEDIDITQLPGYQVAPENCPGWKKAMIEKKNQQLLEEARRDLLAKKAEEEKWKDVPEWKRNLIQEKERKKKEENAPIEMQRKRHEEELNRIQNMPEWKRQIVMKKKD